MYLLSATYRHRRWWWWCGASLRRGRLWPFVSYLKHEVLCITEKLRLLFAKFKVGLGENDGLSIGAKKATYCNCPVFICLQKT